MAEKTFSKEELATFNGQNGQPAYVAVNGIVYDVSDKKAWTDGKHDGHIAGQDLTDALLNVSPPGDSVLKGLPVVVKLI